MKIVYIYSGARKTKFSGRIHIDYPDTQLYGENHLEKIPDVYASYKETSDFIANPILRGLLGFRLLHALSYFFTFEYDIVVGSSLYYSLILRKIYRGRQKFVLLNFSLTRIVHTTKSRLGRYFLAWILNEANLIICPSAVQKNFLDQSLPKCREKTVVVPLGIDDVYYLPHYKNRENYILSVGRDNGRDYVTVVETAKLLPLERFLIVCSERNLVCVSDIPSNVEIKYDVDIKRLRELYYSAKLMVLATQDDSFEDGSDCSGQTVLLEAMASGLPVIASRKKYINEYVQDGEDALLVNFYDVEDIVKKIKIFNSRTESIRIAKSARIRVEKDFSTRRMAENLYDVFKRMM